MVQKIIQFLIRHPFEVVFSLAVLPAIVTFGSIIFAGFFLLISIVIATIFVFDGFKQKSRKKHFIGGSYVFLGSVFFFLTLKISWFWLTIFPLITALYFISQKNKLAVRLEKKDLDTLKYIYIVGIFFIAIMPFIESSLNDKFVQDSILKAKSQNNIIDNEINSAKKEVAIKTKTIDEDPIMGDYIAANKISELATYSQTKMLQSDLSSLTITDGLGNVLIRAHKPVSVGDNILNSNPFAKDILEGKPGSSIERSSDGLLSNTAGTPVIKDGKIIGAIFGGYLFNDKLAKSLHDKTQINVGFLTDGKIYGYYSDSKDIFRFLASQSFAPLSSKDEGTVIAKNGQTYTVYSSIIKDSGGRNAGNIITVSFLGSSYANVKTWLILMGLGTVALIVFAYREKFIRM